MRGWVGVRFGFGNGGGTNALYARVWLISYPFFDPRNSTKLLSDWVFSRVYNSWFLKLRARM